MLGLFRRLRRQVFTGNPTAKYLAYALGEIVLVDFEFRQYVILPDEAAFLASDDLRNILILNRSNYDGSIEYMEDGAGLINDILTIVDQELTKK